MPYAEKEIYDKIKDITISMKAIDKLKMPELIKTNVEVTMNSKERQRYDQFKKELVMDIQDGEITAANAASLTNKLSQLANGAIYDEEKNVVRIHEHKLDHFLYLNYVYRNLIRPLSLAGHVESVALITRK